MSADGDRDLLIIDDGGAPGLLRAPRLPAVLDFERLRLEGIDEIQRLGRAHWTDYNSHDPGITLLEALTFAVNDLGYRAGFPMADLLARSDGMVGPDPGQGPLFSARTILPGGAVTPLDLRKVAVDVEGVKNAWLLRAPAPNVPFFADRAASVLGYTPPPTNPSATAVQVRGVWDVALELGRDPVAGDLADNSFPFRVTVAPGQTLVFDLVLPPWYLWRQAGAPPGRALAFDDPWLTDTASAAVAQNVRVQGEALLLDLEISAPVAGATVKKIMAARLFQRADPRAAAAHQTALLAALTDLSDPRHPVHAYRRRVRRALAVSREVQAALERQRPLCELFHEPSGASFLEIGVCADIDVDPRADIEALAARIYAFLDGLWSPPVRFRTLGELQRQGVPVETIFEGPRLAHGFLLDEDLRASEPPAALHASDVIRGIMDLQAEGVQAVRTLALSSYRDDGTVEVNGAPWTIPLSPGQLPRFAADKTRFVFYKQGIPFRPRRDELAHKIALFAARGGAGAKPADTALDLPAVRGRHRRLAEYRPVREDLPFIYGVGRDGLPPDATPARKAQAAQLTAYLMLFDQLLANGLAQLSHLEALFALTAEDAPTYYAAPLAADPSLAGVVRDAGAWLLGSDGRDLLADTPEVQRERRNRLLDHLLARFDEDFAGYSALVADLRTPGGGGDPAPAKARFLADYPALSYGRGLGADLHDPAQVWMPGNLSGLERRLMRLLGIQPGQRRNLAHNFELYQDAGHALRFRLRDLSGQILLSSSTHYSSATAAAADMDAVARRAAQPGAYRVETDVQGRFYVNLVDEGDAVVASRLEDVVARRLQYFPTRAAAEAAVTHTVAVAADRAAQEGFHLVEHVLLRPELQGLPADPGARDRLMAVTLDADCAGCAEHTDPYSFRATLVVPEWPARFRDPAFRAFVERTARLEAPAHVFLKICWVDVESMQRFEAAYTAFLEQHAREPRDPEQHSASKGALIQVLESLRSVYPAATLHDCLEDAGDNPVRLGFGRLGNAEGT